MEQISVGLFWLSLALYIAATVLYAYQFVLKRPKVGWWARFLTGAGFICQTLSIGANSMANNGTPLTGPNQLILASWALVLLYFVMEHLIKIKVYGAFLIPVAVVLMIAGQLLGGPGVAGNPKYAAELDSWRVGFHVLLVIFANAGFMVGAISSALYLLQDSMFKAHRTNTFSRRMPSLSTLQTTARRAIALAYPIYTAGLMLGVIRALEVDVQGWWADPRIMVAGVVWATFGAYLVLVYRHDVSGRMAAWIAIGGAVAVVLLAIIARTLPTGFHVFGIETAFAVLRTGLG